ncbi:MAG: DUF3303 domain-containing protein [Methanomassiliicoccales archaeon]|nr:DUF3303 domain-containing protein [Methanomassiliicoccales archaeon]NYT16065.1 DUF3303 domain-containing protein [Methanomassiliicoccales archaeon]
MKFLAFWKLGKNITSSKLGKVAAEIMKKEAFPTKGVEVHEWLVCPGGKGVILMEANNEADIFRAYTIWADAIPGFFDEYEVLPAVEVADAVSIALE